MLVGLKKDGTLWKIVYASFWFQTFCTAYGLFVCHNKSLKEFYVQDMVHNQVCHIYRGAVIERKMILQLFSENILHTKLKTWVVKDLELKKISFLNCSHDLISFNFDYHQYH